MSAAYNQVPRLSTGPKMMGHHSRDQMQHDGATQAPFAADQPNAKQRKWRVLVSIGLLLPALAAIIGIVAWTISIEVSSGNQQSPVSMAQRRTERAQMEQFRRDEALALAALVAARRSARQSHTLAATGSAPQSHQKQQQQQPAPLAEAIVAQPNSAKAQRSATPTTRPTRSNPQQQQQQQQQRQVMSSNKQPQHQMSKSSDETSSTVLKNREQADTTPNNESSESQEPTASASSQEANFGQDEELAAGRQSEEATRSQQADSQSGSDVSRDADDSASDFKSQPSRSRLAERFEQRPVEAETEDERAPGSSTESSSADAEPAPAKKARQNSSGAFKQSKSRWLSGKRPTSSFPTAESPVAPVVTRKLASPKDNHSRAQVHKDKQQETAKSVKTKSKYTLLSAFDAANANADNNDDHSERPTASSSTPSQPQAESATVDERDNEQQEPRLDDFTTTSSTTTQPSTSECHERVEQEARANKAVPTTRDEDEEISFEAIASAISKTLSADEQPAESKQPAELANSAEQTGDEQAPSETGGSTSDSSDSSQAEPAAAVQKRRRTTGEHLAEVIDHLVERRKQQHQDGSRFGDRAAFPNDQERSPQGPQIVVVAPLGASGALLKARSLTKAEEPSNATATASTTTTNSPIRAPPSNTKAGSTKSAGFKKPVEALKKQPAEVKSAKPIGARLIGVGPSLDSPDKYSERVEVIEDDDSSSLLLPKSATASDQAALESEHVASIHVSSHSGEPRFRSPRHELSSSQMFERYAPVARSFSEQPPPARQAEPRARSDKSANEAKLYSAEQLIRNHILRSKANNNNNNNNRPVARYQQQQQQQQPIRKEEMRAKQEETGSTLLPPVSSTSTQSSTSANPQGPSKAPETQANRQQQRQQEPEMMLPQQSQKQLDQTQFSSSVQSVAVPAFYMHKSPLRVNQQQQQQFNQPFEAFQVMESQQQQMRAEPSQGQREYFQEQQQQQQHQQEQADSQQEQQQQRHPQSSQPQPQMQQYLPTFADQEIQVPAHMAESVIRDLQQSASSVTGMLHGQPMVFQALPPGQQPRLPAHFFQNPGQQAYHRFNSMMPSQQQQQQQQQYQTAESQLRAQFAQPNRVQSESQQAASSAASPSTSSSSSYSLNPFALVSRLVGGRRQQGGQKRKELQEGQVLANRDSVPKEQQQPVEQERETRSSRFIGTVKSFGPRSLVQPVAQLALKQVLSSIGQQAEALEQQAAAQQAEADAAEQAASQQQLRHSPTQQQRSSAPHSPQQQAASAADAIQMSGSSPIGMAALPPPSQRDQLAGAASSRSLRSLPIGAQAPASQQLVQIPIADQEVQESYGQMPAYHMPDHYNGGGGARGYHPPGGYGGAHYESPDKKSKGITFHFGGGPVGGGTQLITSPMGIFKHLMIPLTRSQSSLNGKISLRCCPREDDTHECVA